MTTMEKIATNFLTIVIARIAMTATPLVGFLLWSWLDTHFADIAASIERIDRRVAAVEAITAASKVTIQDHESRISVSDSRREELRKSMDDQFTKVSTTMELLADKIQSLDGNVIRLGTIIAERVPKTEQQSNLKP